MRLVALKLQMIEKLGGNHPGLSLIITVSIVMVRGI
jgi:hypothetical protein